MSFDETRESFVVIDSKKRDSATWSDRSHFLYDLGASFENVCKAELSALQIPTIHNVTSRNNQMVLLHNASAHFLKRPNFFALTRTEISYSVSGLSFNSITGTDDYLVTATNLTVPYHTFSVVLWVSLDPGGVLPGGTVLEFGTVGGTPHTLDISTTTGKAFFTGFGQTVTASDPDLRDSNWHCVAVTGSWTASVQTVTVYVDGLQKATSSFAQASSSFSAPAGVRVSRAYEGQVDEVAVYDVDVGSLEVRRAAAMGDRYDHAAEAGIWAYWSFVGGSLVDSSSHGYDLTVPPFPSYGDLGVIFDGASDYLSLGSATGLPSTVLTMCAWIVVRGTDGVVVSWGSATSGYARGIRLNAGVLEFFGHGTATASSGSADLRDTFFHHVVVTLDTSRPQQLEFFVDGSPVATANPGSALYAPGTAALYVGQHVDGTRRFGGNIDEVAIYSAVLSDAAIQSIYLLGGTHDHAADSDIVSYYSFADRSYADLAGSNDLSATGAPIFDELYNFDGVIDNMIHPYAVAFPQDPFTLCAWVFPYAGSGTIVSYGEASGERMRCLRVDASGYLEFDSYTSQSNGGAATDVLSAGDWHHVAVAFDSTWGAGTQLRFYVNGVLRAQMAPTAPLQSFVAAEVYLSIGRNTAATDFYDGDMDEIAIYSTGLSTAQILAMYNGKRSYDHSAQAGVVGAWNFTLGATTDESGNDLTLTASEAPLAATGTMSPIANDTIVVHVQIPTGTYTTAELAAALETEINAGLDLPYAPDPYGLGRYTVTFDEAVYPKKVRVTNDSTDPLYYFAMLPELDSATYSDAFVNALYNTLAVTLSSKMPGTISSGATLRAATQGSFHGLVGFDRRRLYTSIVSTSLRNFFFPTMDFDINAESLSWYSESGENELSSTLSIKSYDESFCKLYVLELETPSAGAGHDHAMTGLTETEQAVLVKAHEPLATVTLLSAEDTSKSFETLVFPHRLTFTREITVPQTVSVCWAFDDRRFATEFVRDFSCVIKLTHAKRTDDAQEL
jgi:hypothetical protein